MLTSLYVKCLSRHSKCWHWPCKVFTEMIKWCPVYTEYLSRHSKRWPWLVKRISKCWPVCMKSLPWHSKRSPLYVNSLSSDNQNVYLWIRKVYEAIQNNYPCMWKMYTDIQNSFTFVCVKLIKDIFQRLIFKCERFSRPQIIYRCKGKFYQAIQNADRKCLSRHSECWPLFGKVYQAIQNVDEKWLSIHSKCLSIHSKCMKSYIMSRLDVQWMVYGISFLTCQWLDHYGRHSLCGFSCWKLFMRLYVVLILLLET